MSKTGTLLCPGCGKKMQVRCGMVRDRFGAYFECRCGWRSPVKWGKTERASIRNAQKAMKQRYVDKSTSDGYHTFDELYHHRAVLFSVIVADHRELAWKSKKHSDGTMYEGSFIVGIDTPNGSASYHYHIDPYWDMFDCKELERAPVWDGYTSDQAIERIGSLRQ